MVVCNESTRYERVCKDEFAGLHAKLDRLDEAIRGNGQPGLSGDSYGFWWIGRSYVVPG